MIRIAVKKKKERKNEEERELHLKTLTNSLAK